jgi:hypothetical protein
MGMTIFHDNIARHNNNIYRTYKMKIKYSSSLVFVALLSCAAHAAPKNLNGYDQLLQSLHQGNDVKAIIYFDQCSVAGNASNNPRPASGADSRINFNTYLHYKVKDGQQEKFAIATSISILTEHRTLGPINAYMRVRVFDDNSAEVHEAYYDAKTFEAKGVMDWACQVGNGLMLYTDN